MNDSSISIRPVTDLLADSEGNPAHYWIPAYQRGYRWKPLQVTQLLDDVWEFIQNTEDGDKHSFYCLQPLVIKVHEGGRYEVVDGQQRLTTIYILFTYLKEIMDVLGKVRFTLTFETRGKTNDAFLADIDPKRANENIDFFHICEAYRAIEAWFSERDTMHKLKLLQHFLNDDEAGRNVKVIWFQLSDTDNAVDAFTRLNVGKIPLTNDELIRALFLRRQPTDEFEAKALQLRIAHEWDQLEKSLQSDSFWYFISNEDGPKQNRIGFLFDFVAKADGLLQEVKHDPYMIFHIYNSKIKNDPADLKNEWLRIKQAHMMLEEWYENRVLYHLTGFLIQQGVKIAEIRELSAENTKSEFEQKLRQKIFREIIGPGSLSDIDDEELSNQIKGKMEDLEYGRGKHNAEIRAMLLLFNIATLLDNPISNIRFQFDCFKQGKWDIEHVRSVTQYQPQRHHERVAWFTNILGCSQIHDNNQKLQEDINSFISRSQNEVSDDEFEILYKDVLKEFGEYDEYEGAHSIANLTLLDQQTNRSYKNAVFAMKRQRVLSLDQGGIFIPLCTRNVFMKCYSPDAGDLMFWKERDQANYQAAIEKTLVRFFMSDSGNFHE